MFVRTQADIGDRFNPASAVCEQCNDSTIIPNDLEVSQPKSVIVAMAVGASGID